MSRELTMEQFPQELSELDCLFFGLEGLRGLFAEGSDSHLVGSVRGQEDVLVSSDIAVLDGFVEAILGPIASPQVFPSVIERVAVDVVYFPHRPLTGHVEERSAMHSAYNTTEAEADILGISAGCDRTGSPVIAGTLDSTENAGFGVVVEVFDEVLMRPVGIFHGVPLGGSYNHCNLGGVPNAS